MLADGLRVGLLPERLGNGAPSPCGELRLLAPYLHPDFASHYNVELMTGLDDRRFFDVVVAQRFIAFDATYEQVEAFLAHLARWGSRLVYDLDDNLLDRHPVLAVEREVQRFRPQIRLLLRSATLVTVSTPKLAERVKRIATKTIVVANALPDHWQRKVLFPQNEPDGVVIGYYGSFTHQRDYMNMIGGLRGSLRYIKSPCRIELCGVTSDPRFFSLLSDIADVRVIDVQPNYPQFFRMFRDRIRWDIGLAPLARGSFEDSKSDIKYLEYAAFGYAGVYSRCPPYERVEDGATGLVCENRADDWTQAILTLANGPALRQSIVERSRKDVIENRSTSANGKLLRSAFNEAF